MNQPGEEIQKSLKGFYFDSSALTIKTLPEYPVKELSKNMTSCVAQSPTPQSPLDGPIISDLDAMYAKSFPHFNTR